MPRAAQDFPDLNSLADETGSDLTVCQCSGCGLVQLSTDPVPYYREVIRAAAVSDIIRDFKLKQFSSFIQKYSLQGKKILEIGCGRGEFLSLLRQFEVDAYGLEYADESVAHCIDNGLRVFKGYPDSNAGILDNGPFDAFLLLMFLEHMPWPNDSLRNIFDNLSDNAVGLIEVPNFDMILRKKLFSEFISDHLLYFSRDTLHMTLTLNGFDVMECGEIRDDYVISAVVRKKQKLDISHFCEHQAKITSDINDFISRFKEKKVAIWGAGHQALAVIALTKIGDKIRYVIDSASFKQGKYTPVTHLPIVAPETLYSEPIEAVIVMAASYSDEVAEIIRRRFGQSLQVAILRDFGLEIV